MQRRKRTVVHPDLQNLLNALRELENFLDHQGEPFWATNVRRCADRIEKSDAYGLQHYINLFGGMGSLNDLVLYRDGSWLTKENDRLAALRSKTWALASQLKREVDTCHVSSEAKPS
ncbi:DUF6966 domain-containing protein [Rhizobium herbae]|uniref:DUF6966 domain-containing protein n=1 Tax=Rhizobium herbae TaxID=508661 RepID=A0ABS4EP17_9HYPH|nr:hypothetical protein [Rhizobium herbae]MBP1859688.1 hypothetical protein [Rhizobium herbae]